MPRGHRQRSQEDYEREIAEAVKRMRKRPESLQSARDSERWLAFLENIGVNSDILESESGQNFWERVRDKINPEFTQADLQQYIARGIIVTEIKYKTGRTQQVGRDSKGRFVSLR